MPIYPFHCPGCDEEIDNHMTFDEYEVFEEAEHPRCGAFYTKQDRIICAASVTRASFVDGTKRKGFAENKEMLKMKMAEYSMKPEDRKEIRKERKTLEKKL